MPQRYFYVVKLHEQLDQVVVVKNTELSHSQDSLDLGAIVVVVVCVVAVGVAHSEELALGR